MPALQAGTSSSAVAIASSRPAPTTSASPESLGCPAGGGGFTRGSAGIGVGVVPLPPTPASPAIPAGFGGRSGNGGLPFAWVGGAGTGTGTSAPGPPRPVKSGFTIGSFFSPLMRTPYDGLVQDTRLPVTLLTGFLGAGKTTLLNRLLSQDHGERIAVIVNEFGDVGIDGTLVRGTEDEVIELTNGCVCCTVRGDLERTAIDLLTRRDRRLLPLQFDRIVIEASGLASPGPVIQTFLISGELAARTRVTGVLALAHAQHIERQLRTEPIAAEQLAYADQILLNHSDMATPDTLLQARAAIHHINAMVDVQHTVLADIPAEMALTDGWQPATEALPHAPHESGVATLTLTHTGELDIHRLKMWLRFVASRKTHEIMRMKGILRCEGRPNAVVVQAVYQWLELGPSKLAPPEQSRLVIIGRNLDPDEIRRGWSNVCDG